MHFIISVAVLWKWLNFSQFLLYKSIILQNCYFKILYTIQKNVAYWIALFKYKYLFTKYTKKYGAFQNAVSLFIWHFDWFL